MDSNMTDSTQTSQRPDHSDQREDAPVDVIILAAGKGTRMYSDKPKVLHELAGKPMLEHVLDAARQLHSRHIHVVTGFQSEQIRQRFTERADIQWVEQAEQLGTGQDRKSTRLNSSHVRISYAVFCLKKKKKKNSKNKK